MRTVVRLWFGLSAFWVVLIYAWVGACPPDTWAPSEMWIPRLIAFGPPLFMGVLGAIFAWAFSWGIRR
jgi:hypothetical protein